jgi:hypothetical protein
LEIRVVRVWWLLGEAPLTERRLRQEEAIQTDCRLLALDQAVVWLLLALVGELGMVFWRQAAAGRPGMASKRLR